MKVSAFDYELPESAIAKAPLEPRDACRLLHVGEALSDHIFTELGQFLQTGDLLVCNDSRVIPARLFGTRGGDETRQNAQIELLLHQPVSDGSDWPSIDKATRWTSFAKPARKLKTGDIITLGQSFQAIVEQKRDDGQLQLRFDLPEGTNMLQALETHGHVPLPPYIDRPDCAQDESEYQTVFANQPGSVAAPTAGLHLTHALLQTLASEGIDKVDVTLHIGAGTFQPVKVEDTNDHIMHQEWAELSDKAAQRINAVKASGGRVIAVGTTAMRTLESAAVAHGRVAPFCGNTDLFITPGFDFNIVDKLITNFHLPQSTLLMLVAAFSGLNRIKAAYAHAIAEGYRFYSYGDACLLERLKQDLI